MKNIIWEELFDIKSQKRPGNITTIGSSSHSKTDRQTEDYYATEPKATQMFVDMTRDLFQPGDYIWEPCCGQGHMPEVLKTEGYNVFSTDIIDRGYGDGVKNFLSNDIITTSINGHNHHIVTNPPYNIANDIITKAMNIIHDAGIIAMFLPTRYLEGKSRRHIFDIHPPLKVFISSSRLKCAKNGDFENVGESAVAYMWIIWKKGYKGATTLHWFN